jgi:hypothetical protein
MLRNTKVVLAGLLLVLDGFTNAPGIQIVAASDADARELVRRLRGD